MSDSVTNVDVEDVLSSIRRLVSDTNSDVRPTPEAQPEPAAEQTNAAPEEALLLTSALRVPPSVGSGNAEASNGDTPVAGLSNLRGAIEGKDTAANDASEWPVTHDDYYEDDEPEDVNPVIDFIRHDRKDHAASDVSATEAVEDAAAPSDQDIDHDETTDWSPQFVHAQGEAEPVDTSEIDEDVPFEFAEVQQSEVEEIAVPEWVEAGLAEISEAEIVEDVVLEEVIVEDAQTEEPQAAVGDAELDYTEDRADDDQVELMEESVAPETVFASAAAASVFAKDDETDDAEADDGLGDFDEGIIDEDALRDLVSEIVRQELTGELGERITRNVRKLVRREIHRAMLTREFD